MKYTGITFLAHFVENMEIFVIKMYIKVLLYIVLVVILRKYFDKMALWIKKQLTLLNPIF